MSTVFSNNPFLRLLFPFIAGIVISIQFGFEATTWPVLLAAFLALIALNAYGLKQSSLKYLFVITCDLFLFCFATETVKLSKIESSDNYYGRNITGDSVANKFLAVVDEVPVETGKFKKCRLEICGFINDSGLKEVKGSVIGYFKTGNNRISAGDQLLINTKLISPPAPKNPFEFDYNKYLQHKQIHHTFFADSTDFVTTETGSFSGGLWATGLKIKEKILAVLNTSGLDKDASSICAALLTGFDDDIEAEVSEAFSHSGTLHVLSVSGLHTGLIYLSLIFLFDLFDKHKRFKLIRFTTVVLVLWLFALITGFNAPVLRAVIMFSLLGAGKIFFRADSRTQINILAATAFIMLCYNPFFIVDVGFQLSFSAVGGIFILQPWIFSLYETESRMKNWLWQAISTSAAATISTLPLTLFYFKQFPLWFFATNLFVVPLVFVLLLLTILIVFKLSFLSTVVNALVALLVSFMSLFNSPGWGYIDNIDFGFIDALILTVLLFFSVYSLYFRSRRSVLIFLIILIFWQVNSLAASHQSKSSRLLSLYHIKKEQGVCVKNSTIAFINNISRKNFNYHVKPHFISFNYADTVHLNLNFVGMQGAQYLVLNKKNYWPDADFSKITHLLISNNFTLAEEDLIAFKKLHTVIVDGTNNAFTKRKLAELCRKFSIGLYDTHKNGAYIASL